MSAIDLTLYKITKNTIESGLELGNNIPDIIAKMEQNVAYRRNLPQALKEIALSSPQTAIAILSAHSAFQLLDDMAKSAIIAKHSHNHVFWNSTTAAFFQQGSFITKIAENNVDIAIVFLTTPAIRNRLAMVPDIIQNILTSHKDNPVFFKKWNTDVTQKQKAAVYSAICPTQGRKLAKLDHLLYKLSKENASFFSLFRRKAKQEKIQALTELKDTILANHPPAHTESPINNISRNNH